MTSKERLRALWRKARRKYVKRHRRRAIDAIRRYEKKNPEKVAAWNRKRYIKHRAKRLAYQSRWYQENKDTIRSRVSELHKRCPEHFMFYSAKCRAKKYGVPFSISMDDIIIPKTCPALGIPLKIATGKTSHNSPTVDRIIPSLGYVPGNIAVISHRANRIKGDASFDEISGVASYVMNKTRKGKNDIS